MWIAFRRQRRRIALTLLFATLAVGVAMLRQSGWFVLLQDSLGQAGQLAALQTAATVLGLVYLATLVLLRATPTLRRQCEVAAISALVFELLCLGLAYPDEHMHNPLLAVSAFVVIMVGVDHLLYGRVLDRIGLWRPLAASCKMTVTATRHAVWNAVVPRPETVANHWIGALAEVARTNEPEVFSARYRLGDGTILQKTLTFLDSDHPNHVRYHFEPEASPQDLFDEDNPNRASDHRFGAGFCALWFEPQDHGKTQVTLSCEYTALRLRTALQLWLDDWLASEADAMAAFIEQRPDMSLHTRLWGEVLRQDT